jgi:hypothetical protein
VHSEPEFDGETILESQAAPVKSEGCQDKRHDEPPLSFSASRLGAIVPRRYLSEAERENIRRVHAAYHNYFTHISFRNGWSKPSFTKEEVDELFQDAANIVVRVRSHLDRQAGDNMKLRLLDGEAQKFLHSKDARALLEKNPREFVVALVDSTFRDAVGYVENLSRKDIVDFCYEISAYQFNPRTHLLHVIEVAQAKAANSFLPVERHFPDGASWTQREFLGVQGNQFYCPEGSPEEKEWRDAIRTSYELLEKVAQLERKYPKREK